MPCCKEDVRSEKLEGGMIHKCLLCSTQFIPANLDDQLCSQCESAARSGVLYPNWSEETGITKTAELVQAIRESASVYDNGTARECSQSERSCDGCGAPTVHTHAELPMCLVCGEMFIAVKKDYWIDRQDEYLKEQHRKRSMIQGND
jgi:hypothetical protein